MAEVSRGRTASVGTVFRLSDSAATTSKIEIYPPEQETEERPVDKDDRNEETFPSVECGTCPTSLEKARIGNFKPVGYIFTMDDSRRLQARFSPLLLDKDIFFEKKSILVKVAHSGIGDGDITSIGERIASVAECIKGDECDVIPLDIFLEMNFISDEGVSILLNNLTLWSSSSSHDHDHLCKIQLRRLRLHMCRVSDIGCEKLADYILNCSRERLPTEIHLSHNRISSQGCIRLLSAVGRKYPRVGAGNAPLWLRLEHNYIDVKEVRKSVNTRWCECVPSRCSPLTCVKSTLQSPVHVHLPHFSVQRAALSEVALIGLSDLVSKAERGSRLHIRGEGGVFASSSKSHSATAREDGRHVTEKDKKSLSSTYPPSLLTRPRIDPVVPALVSTSVVPNIPVLGYDLTPEMIDSFLAFPEDEKSVSAGAQTHVMSEDVQLSVPLPTQTPLPSVQEFIDKPAVSINSFPSSLVTPAASAVVESTSLPPPPPSLSAPPPPPPSLSAPPPESLTESISNESSPATPSHLFVVLDTSAIVRMMDSSVVFSFEQLGLTQPAPTGSLVGVLAQHHQNQSVTFVVLETVLQQLDANKQAPFMYGTRERAPSAHINAMRLHVNGFFKLYPLL